MLTPDSMWRAVVENDASKDGSFVYAIKTTGIYCRPFCRSRLPNRENVCFFISAQEAETSGYRPCKRCQPDRMTDPAGALAAAVCRLLEQSAPEGGMTLRELAGALHVSEAHLQRTFKAVMGISPRAYAEALRTEALKSGLKKGAEVLTAASEAGFTSASQLYDRLDQLLAMTPAEYRAGGGDDIRCALAESPLGWIIVAATPRGICAVRLGDDPEALLADLRQEYPAVSRIDEDPFLERALRAILDQVENALPPVTLPLDIRATAFQKRVWDALRRIPPGQTRSYSEIAADINQPAASRAVGSACAANPVALVIPCHRAVRADGNPGHYRWGDDRKARLLALEAQDDDTKQRK